MNTQAEKQQTFAIEFTSELDNLAVARDFCDDVVPHFFDNAKIEQTLIGLHLSVTEAVVNVIHYGYGDEQGHPIECRVTSDESFQFEILHRGQPFNPPDEVADITEPQEGGMGLFLIEQCMDEVTYTQTPDGRQCIRFTLHY